MSIFKTNKEIFESNDLNFLETNSPIYELPPRIVWDYKKTPTVKKIEVWEVVYYEPGNVGIYAAWSPYAEFYMIVYDLFKNTPGGVETFYGEYAAVDIFKKCQTLGITLTINKIWIDRWHTTPFNKIPDHY
jgi:hypothetical protein